MNPRILKKLSKRVAALYVSGTLYLEEDRCGNTADRTPRGASRKPSHRETPWSSETYRDGRPRLGDMYVMRGTPWYTWTYSTQDGTDYDSAVAWEWMVEMVRGEIQDEATDWGAPESSWINGYPPIKGGKPPKYPRNTWSMLRAIEAKYAPKPAPALFYPTPPELVRVLTEDAELDRLDWKSLGGCTCFISPPCSSCTHEGHPTSQEETPECWQMVPADSL